jgi:hypothetical protein
VTAPPPAGPGDPQFRPPHGYGPPPVYGPPGYGPPPGYQQPPAGLGYGPPAGPIRPRLLWVWLTWVLFVALAVIGTILFVGGLISTVGDAAPSTTFASGEDVVVRLDPADKPAIYATSGSATNVNCQIFARETAEGLSLTQPGGNVTVTVNGTRWEQVFRIGVPRPDEYRIICEGPGARFGVGKDLAAGKVAGAAIIWIVLPAIGFVAAVVTTIVVLVKRSNARKRLHGFSTY